VAAVAGTFATMLLMPGTALPGMELAATLLLGLGLVISIAAKLQLRRSFGLVAANRGVKTRGVYGLVRHPMYLGYFLSQWGMLLINWSWWNGGLLALWSVLQIARIHAEERVLCEDPAYRGHCERVRHRLVPLVY
jgi:protein-S-isoprenylcysteine O-methyltransferase Ste14